MNRLQCLAVGLLAMCVQGEQSSHIVILKEGVDEDTWHEIQDQYTQQNTKRQGVTLEDLPILTQFSIGGQPKRVENGVVVGSSATKTTKRLMFKCLMSDDQVFEFATQFFTYIDIIEPDYVINGSSIACPDTTATETGWHQKRATNGVGLGESWVHNKNWGEGITVYTLDSGSTCSHPEFGDRCEAPAEANFVSGEGVEDENGHGTHVASVGVGATVGIAPSAKIVSVKCLNRLKSGAVSECASGINWIVDKESERRNLGITTASVLSISLQLKETGGQRSNLLKMAIENAVDAGLVVVVSAGNTLLPFTDNDACQTTPGNQNGVITVGSSTIKKVNGGVQDAVNPTSNQGECVDIFAPGKDVYAAATSVGQYTIMSGTSMATPLVSGMVLAYLSHVKSAATTEEVKAWLIENAHSGLADLQAGSPDRLAHLPCQEAPPAAQDSNRHEGNCFGSFAAVHTTSELERFRASHSGQLQPRCWKVQCPAGTTQVFGAYTDPAEDGKFTGYSVHFNGEEAYRYSYGPGAGVVGCGMLGSSAGDSMVVRFVTADRSDGVPDMANFAVSCQEERFALIRTRLDHDSGSAVASSYPENPTIELTANKAVDCMACKFTPVVPFSFTSNILQEATCFFDAGGPDFRVEGVRLSTTSSLDILTIRSAETQADTAAATEYRVWSSEADKDSPYRWMEPSGQTADFGTDVSASAIVALFYTPSALPLGGLTVAVTFVSSQGDRCGPFPVQKALGNYERFFITPQCSFSTDELEDVEMSAEGPPGTSFTYSFVEVLRTKAVPHSLNRVNFMKWLPDPSVGAFTLTQGTTITHKRPAGFDVPTPAPPTSAPKWALLTDVPPAYTIGSA